MFGNARCITQIKWVSKCEQCAAYICISSLCQLLVSYWIPCHAQRTQCISCLVECLFANDLSSVIRLRITSCAHCNFENFFSYLFQHTDPEVQLRGLQVLTDSLRKLESAVSFLDADSNWAKSMYLSERDAVHEALVTEMTKVCSAFAALLFCVDPFVRFDWLAICYFPSWLKNRSHKRSMVYDRSRR